MKRSLLAVKLGMATAGAAQLLSLILGFVDMPAYSDSCYLHRIGQRRHKSLHHLQLRILLFQFADDASLDISHSVARCRFPYYSCHVQINHVILVQMPLIPPSAAMAKSLNSWAESQVLS